MTGQDKYNKITHKNKILLIKRVILDEGEIKEVRLVDIVDCLGFENQLFNCQDPHEEIQKARGVPQGGSHPRNQPMV